MTEENLDKANVSDSIDLSCQIQEINGHFHDQQALDGNALAVHTSFHLCSLHTTDCTQKMQIYEHQRQQRTHFNTHTTYEFVSNWRSNHFADTNCAVMQHCTVLWP